VRRTPLCWITLTALLAPLTAPAIAAAQADGAPRVERHAGLDAAAEAAGADGLVLVVFSARWCGPCQALKQQTLDTDGFLIGAAPLHLAAVDIDDDKETARRFAVNAIPHLVLMTGQSQIVATTTGFKTSEELIDWIRQARQRVAHGQWLGEGQAGDAGAAGGAVDLAALVKQLADADPARRAGAAEALRAAGAASMPLLIDALGDAYLVVRVEASELLHKMAPAAPAFDPWAASGRRAAQARELAQWWSKTGELPSIADDVALDDAELRTIDEAITAAVGDDPLRRTEAMQTLIRFGPPALPRVRSAIDARAEAGDQKAVWVLEDVRWAILVPRAIESELRVRRALARGTSEQRQDAAARLGDVAARALPVLRELIHDFDPLVREQAAAALTQAPGPAALDALGVLLKADDTNLRMVAAQSLGATESPAAAARLVPALQDADEVVATVAIAAMQQVEAAEPTEHQALIACLEDPRWRIRAAAAETLGKFKVAAAAEPVSKLLDDKDPFVVRKAIESLERLGIEQSTDRLVSLARRDPDLVGVVVGAIMNEPSIEAVKTVESIYDAAPQEARVELVDALAQVYSYRSAVDAYWRPLLEKIAANESAEVRRKLPAVLARRTRELAAEFITPLLEDEDLRVAQATLGPVIRIAAWRWGVAEDEPAGQFGVLAGRNPADNRSSDRFGVTAEQLREIIEHNPEQGKQVLQALGDDLPPGFDPDGGPKEGAATVLPHVLRRRIIATHTQWHELIAKRFGDDGPPLAAIAYYATGDGDAGLERLARTLATAELETLLDGATPADACGVILTRLPWPQGRAVIEAILTRPLVYAAVLRQCKHAGSEARAMLLDPDHVAAQVVAADDRAFDMLADLLLAGWEDTALDLGVDSQASRPVIDRLLASESPRARAVAVFAMGQHLSDKSLTRIKAMRNDTDAAVRQVVAEAIAARVGDQRERERLLGPMLSDAAPPVVAGAASGILSSEIRRVAELPPPLSRFYVLGATTYRYNRYDYSDSDETAIAKPFDHDPGFLDLAEQLYHAPEADAAVKPTLALLLAQYRRFEPLDQIVEARAKAAKDRTQPDPLATLAMQLTGDPKHLNTLRAQIGAVEDEYDLRELLRSLQGVNGPEARELRREINRRLREGDRY